MSKTITYRDYVIVVHGIGEQRPNETVLPVINRFAEIRHDKLSPTIKQVVTLGMVTSQSGKPQRLANRVSFGGCRPWSEFKHIPSEKPQKPSDLPPFYGEMAQDGSNIRFVDMYWADIMQRHFEDVGQAVKRWAESLIGRLERKQRAEGNHVQESWVLPILYSLEETFRFLENQLFMKFSLIDKRIFNDYLGDIQLYGEYENVRGEAINRFHHLFEKIEYHHKKAEELDDSYYHAATDSYVRPRYTIIAHSLGTVLTMEALVYAHTKTALFHSQEDNVPNFPLAGYHEEQNKKGDALGAGWIDNIDSLVTLACPLDKFLVIWWNNFKYLESDFFLKERTHKINVFNYCDEQDPVGHTIDILEEKKAFQKLFVAKEDIVYNRYIVPGAAHISYWEDIELFERIASKIIDRPAFKELNETQTSDSKDSFLLCKKEVYSKVLFYTYFFFPLISVVVLSVLYIGFFYSEIFILKVVMGMSLVTGAYIMFRLIKLMIWWRQTIRIKHKKNTIHIEGQEQLTFVFNLVLRFLVVLHTLGAIFYIPTYVHYAISETIFTSSLTSLVWQFIITSLMAGVIYYRFKSNRRVQIPEHSLVSTLVASLSVFGVILMFFTLKIVFSNGLFFFSSIVLATYLGVSTIVWTYTLLSYIYTKKILNI